MCGVGEGPGRASGRPLLGAAEPGEAGSFLGWCLELVLCAPPHHLSLSASVALGVQQLLSFPAFQGSMPQHRERGNRDGSQGSGSSCPSLSPSQASSCPWEGKLEVRHSGGLFSAQAT